MKKLNLLLTLMFATFFAGFAQFQLNTVPPLNGGNGNAGVTFGLSSNQTILIDTIFCTFNTAGATDVWVTTTDLTGPPNVSTANGWTNLGGASVVSGTTPGNIVPIPFNYSYLVTPGTGYRFYVNGSIGANMAYTTGTGGVAAPFTDGTITIETGNLVGYGGAAPNPGFTPRQFNGGIKYTILGGTNDAGVVSVDSPGVYCSGVQPVVATIRNYGANQIDSVDVTWEVNGVVQGTVKHTTQLDTLNGAGPVSAQISLGSFTFPQGLNDLRVWTSNPNGVADTSNFNDTISVKTGPALNGSFTVDQFLAASATNYTSFSNLASALNTFGMCGPVTVNVAAGSYNDRFSIGNINGISSTNTLTIDGGDSSNTTITNDLSNGDAVIELSGVSFVTIKNLTVTSTRVGGGNHAGIFVGAGSQFDSIVGVRVNVDPNATFNAYGILGSSAPTNTFTSGDNANDITIMNSSVSGGDNSIRFVGNGGRFPGGGSNGGWNKNNKVINSTLESADDICIYFDDQEGFEILNNTIRDMRTTSNFNGYGIEAFDGMDFVISGNNIVVPYTGIYVTNANSAKQSLGSSEISNNISAVVNNHGVWLTNPNNINIWFNSILTLSTQTADAALFLDAGFGTVVFDSLDVRNNIFSAENTFALNLDRNDSVFNKFDNNVFYTASTNLLNINGTNYIDLASYQTAQPAYNAASLDGAPQFASNTNLHVVGAFINGAGDASVPITVDIDGDTRPLMGSTMVDPGADEFDPPACPPVANLSGTNIAAQTADIFWIGSSGSYQYEVVTGGSTIGSGTSTVTALDSVTISGLNPSSVYDFNVREICARGDTSIWLTYTFNTLIQGAQGVNCITGNASYLYTEEFNSLAAFTGNIGTGQQAGFWNSRTGGTPSGNTGPLSAHSGSNYMYYEASGGALNAKIVTPPYDLTAASDSAELSFWMHAFGADMGTLVVGIGTSATGPFTTVFTQIGALQTAQADPFQQVGIRIDQYVGQTIYIEFDHTDGNGFTGDMTIDLLEINTCISCAAPANLVDSNVTATTADFAWTQNGLVQEWEVEYGLSGFTLGTGTNTAAITARPLSVTGLTPNSTYDWYVRSICAPGDTSIWVLKTFDTPCLPFTSGYYTGFEGMATNVNADCWNDYITPFSTFANVWVRSFTGVNGPSAGTQALYIYPQTGFAQGSDTLAAITPQFSDLTAGNKRIRFDANTDDVTVQLIVGTSDKPDGSGTFTPLDTLNFAVRDVYDTYDVNFTTLNGYNGTDEYIYFAHSLPSLGRFDYIRIDEFYYEDIPTCVRPDLLDVFVTGTSTADVSWVNRPGVTTTQFEVEYGPVGFTLGTGTSVVVTANMTTLTGLSPNTFYDAYVRGICGPMDSSFWIGPNTFKTECAPFTSGYYTGFEGMATNVNAECWSENFTNYSPNANIWVRAFGGTAAPSFGSQALYIYPFNSFTQGTDELAAITPNFSDLTLGNKRIRFDANTDDVSVQLIVGTTDIPGNTGTLSPIDTLNFATPDVYATYQVEFTTLNGYNGTDEYIYLAHSLPSTGTFDYIRIDQFNYEDIPSCIRPSNLLASNSQLTSIDLDWTENNTATTWEVSYGAPNVTPNTGTKQIATAKPYTLGGLTASNTYEYFVRSICMAGDTSVWEGPFIFSTANSVPYFNNFEAFTETRGALVTSEGWSNFNTSNPKWQVDVLTTSGATGPAADHTIGSGGKFLYLETSTPGVTGDTDTLYTPSMVVPSSAGPLTMSFWYHMYGNTIGSLEVYLDSAGTLIPLDTIIGQQQTAQLGAWLFDSIPLSGSYNGSSIRFLFVGVRGASFTGDLAIDDFSVDFTVGVNENETAISGFNISPNPSKGLFNVSLTTLKRENVTMNVRDAKGQIVHTENITVNGRYNDNLDLTSLAKGVYYMQIQTETESKVEKLIIQ